MHVVGGHQGQAGLPRQLHQLAVQLLRLLDAVLLHLDEEVAEQLLVPASRLDRIREAPLRQQAGDLAGGAPGESDDPFVVLF